MEFILLQKKRLQRDQVLFLSACVHKKYPLFKGKIKAPLKIVPSKLISKPDLNIISRVILHRIYGKGGVRNTYILHFLLSTCTGVKRHHYAILSTVRYIYIYIYKYNLYQARIY